MLMVFLSCVVDLSRAREKLRLACETSNIDTESEDQPKQKRPR